MSEHLFSAGSGRTSWLPRRLTCLTFLALVLGPSCAAAQVTAPAPNRVRASATPAKTRVGSRRGTGFLWRAIRP